MSTVSIRLNATWRREIFQEFHKKFLKLFFDASHSTEDLMAELEQAQVNIESVNRILEIATNDMNMLEEEAYSNRSKCNIDRTIASIF